jgi:multiple sugar transport system ATP-binding protein
MATLTLHGVTKTFAGGVLAVQDLNLEIRDQELVVLVGPSGCGKTTTLRLIAGLEQPDHGVIRLAGRVIHDRPPRERNVAMVFQHGVLYPHLTVYENLAVGLRWQSREGWIRSAIRRWRDPTANEQPGAGRPDIARQVRDVAELLGVTHLLDRMPRHLSGGESQRVALGRSIVRRPAAFLLDEPFSHLDAPRRGSLREELRRWKHRVGATMLVVTHDQTEALALAERLVVMDGGRIQQVGPPQELYERPANLAVAKFLGGPGLNLIPGRWRRTAAGETWSDSGLGSAPGLVLPLPAGTLDGRVSAERDEVILGVRPEQFWLRNPGANREDRATIDKATIDEAGIRQTVRDDTALAFARGRVVRVDLLGPTRLVRVAVTSAAGAVEPVGSPPINREGQPWELSVLVPAGEAVTAGKEVVLGLDANQANLFDGRTGENLKAIRPRATTPQFSADAPANPKREN